jgi:hypothetical protein
MTAPTEDQDDPTEGNPMTKAALHDHPELLEHVVGMWRLLLALPEDERSRVTEYLTATYAWADVEAEAVRWAAVS